MSTIRYNRETTHFYKELRKRVGDHFKEHGISEKANGAFFIKAAVMLLCYFLMYAAIYFSGENRALISVLYALLGICGVLLGLNIGHDAAHDAVFRRQEHNRWLLGIFEMLGTNSYNWKNRHIGAHHLFPNVMNYDSDIQQSRIVKIFPKDRHSFIHRYQHFYMPLLYTIYLLRWVLYRDFKDVFSKNIGFYDNSNYPGTELARLLFFKVVFFFYMVFLPAAALDLSWLEACLLFLVFTVSGSLVMTLILLSTHVSESSVFPEPDKNGMLPYSWARHQVETASDFAADSFLITHLFGGFNHHVIHHLFPGICHMHYPRLTPILKKTACEFGLEYKSTKYLGEAVLSHFRLLKKNSLDPSKAEPNEVLEF